MILLELHGCFVNIGYISVSSHRALPCCLYFVIYLCFGLMWIRDYCYVGDMLIKVDIVNEFSCVKFVLFTVVPFHWYVFSLLCIYRRWLERFWSRSHLQLVPFCFPSLFGSSFSLSHFHSSLLPLADSKMNGTLYSPTFPLLRLLPLCLVHLCAGRLSVNLIILHSRFLTVMFSNLCSETAGCHSWWIDVCGAELQGIAWEKMEGRKQKKTLQ